jgi:hypothetical protein
MSLTHVSESAHRTVTPALELLSQQALIYSIGHTQMGRKGACSSENPNIFHESASGRVLARSVIDVSQQALETALGKLICDDAFRREFFRDAEKAALRVGLRLTPIELTSLRKINAASIESLARVVDDRIRKAEEPAPRRRT